MRRLKDYYFKVISFIVKRKGLTGFILGVIGSIVASFIYTNYIQSEIVDFKDIGLKLEVYTLKTHIPMDFKPNETVNIFLTIDKTPIDGHMKLDAYDKNITPSIPLGGERNKIYTYYDLNPITKSNEKIKINSLIGKELTATIPYNQFINQDSILFSYQLFVYVNGREFMLKTKYDKSKQSFEILRHKINSNEIEK